MSFHAGRLRLGEKIAAAGAIALAVCMFGLPWYGLTGQLQRTLSNVGASTSVDGWNGLTINRWLMLVTILVALSLGVVQGLLRAPALPVSLSVIATVLGIITSLVLIDRVLIDTPFSSPSIETKFGAYLGLLSALVLTYGAGRSLREEDPPDPARNAVIPTVKLPSSP
jgi:cytochrome b561